jgi:hypothetical protein
MFQVKIKKCRFLDLPIAVLDQNARIVSPFMVID